MTQTSQAHRSRSIGRLAVAVAVVGAALVFSPPASSAPLPLQVTPSSGVSYSYATISGSGCTDPGGKEVLVAGGVHSLAATPPVRFGNFSEVPAADGTWSAQIVVTTWGEREDLDGYPGEVTPGAYEVRGHCGLLTHTEMGNVIPAEPPIVTYAAPFTVLPGGPRPTLTATPSTVTATEDLFLLTASGDHCVRPDGDSEVLVFLYGPEGSDQNSRTYGVSSGGATPDAEGNWSVRLERRTDIPPPVTATYQLVAQCLLGTDGYDSINGFEYPPGHINIVNTTPPAPTPSEPVTAVRASPNYTG